MKPRLENRVAIVTGGGRAIGKTIALELARAGADITIVGLSGAELAETSAEIQALGRRSLVLVADVSKQEPAIAERTLQDLGRIDILVNNAGIIGPTALAVNISRAEWDDVLAVNLTGAFLCSKVVLPTMMAQRSGKIINIASVAGKIAYPLRSPYAVSKWGLIGLTRTLAQELGQYNIQVNAICPGPVQGERMQQVIEQRAKELGRPAKEIEQFYLEKVALKRMVPPEEVAALVVFLASDAANNITGEDIDITAGFGL